jgi:hypothetical protein
MSTESHAAPARPPRVWFVDVVRLLASLQMVNGHTIDAVLLPSIEQGPIFDRYNWARGLVSVCFLMVLVARERAQMERDASRSI